MCVLKADAYGHGAGFLVKRYEELGADFYGVSNIDEAVQLRKSGAKKPILIFGYTDPEMAEILCKYDISQAVFSHEYAEKLYEKCKASDFNLKIHLKIDTGMSRIGFFCQTPEDIEKSVNEIINIKNTMKNLEFEGIFTHFSVSDDVTNNREYTLKQFDNFKTVTEDLERKGVKIPIRHCCNSGAIINFPEMHMDMVRAGITLYGMWPSEEVAHNISLHPVMSLKSHIAFVKTLGKGRKISYGGIYETPSEKRIATIPVGYADGYARGLSNKGYVLIHGKKAPICGRVCMDQFMVDVTEIPEAKEGDPVTLLGKDGSECITMEELGELSGRFNYEFACLITPRVPRICIQES